MLQLSLEHFERVYFTYSRHAAEVALLETGFNLSEGSLKPWGLSSPRLHVFPLSDMRAPFASGSGVCDATVLVPCSMGTLARIASGASTDLISRAADVALKERRRLILCPRETPLSLIHIRNMLAVTEAGAIVAPAMPSYYKLPTSIDDLVDTVVWRLLSLAGIQLPQRLRWGAEEPLA